MVANVFIKKKKATNILFHLGDKIGEGENSFIHYILRMLWWS